MHSLRLMNRAQMAKNRARHMCARVIVTPFFDVPDDHHHRVVLSWLRASLSRDSSSPQQNISSSKVLELNVFSISRHTGVVDSLTKHTNSIAATTTTEANWIIRRSRGKKKTTTRNGCCT